MEKVVVYFLILLISSYCINLCSTQDPPPAPGPPCINVPVVEAEANALREKAGYPANKRMRFMKRVYCKALCLEKCWRTFQVVVAKYSGGTECLCSLNPKVAPTFPSGQP